MAFKVRDARSTHPLMSPMPCMPRMLLIPLLASLLHYCVIRWLQTLLKPTFPPLTARHVRAGRVGGDGAHPWEGQRPIDAKERARRRPRRRAGGALQGAPSALRGWWQREGPRESPKGRLWAHAMAPARRPRLRHSVGGLGRLQEPLYVLYCTMRRVCSCLCPLLSGASFAPHVQQVPCG